MNRVIRVVLADPDEESRKDLNRVVSQIDFVWMEGECSRYEFLLDVVEQSTPDVAIVSLDSQPEKALALVQRLTAECPDCSVLVVSSSSDGQQILQAMRAGAKEYLTLPLAGEELVQAMQRIAQMRFGASDGRSRGNTVIAVCGAAGGVGATSVAVNLACILAQDERNSVALMDLDLALGDADVFLDAMPDYTLADVAQNISRLDFTLLKKSLTKHESGVYLLPRPVQLQDTELIGEKEIERIFGLLKATFSHLVVDLSKSYNVLDQTALRHASHILLVTQLDLPCLRNVVRLIKSVSEFEDIDEKIQIVVNRVGQSSGQISLKKAEDTINREVFWRLPNDYRTMVQVRNNGVPLVSQAPKASITQAMLGMAHSLCGDESELADEPELSETAKKNGWLKFFGKKER